MFITACLHIQMNEDGSILKGPAECFEHSKSHFSLHKQIPETSHSVH